MMGNLDDDMVNTILKAFIVKKRQESLDEFEKSTISL
jgi:uncharacterized protein YqeY